MSVIEKLQHPTNLSLPGANSLVFLLPRRKSVNSYTIVRDDPQQLSIRRKSDAIPDELGIPRGRPFYSYAEDWSLVENTVHKDAVSSRERIHVKGLGAKPSHSI